MTEARGYVSAVVEGREGRLFLGRQDGFDLEHFARGALLAPDRLLQWRRTLTRRGRELRDLGIPYIVLIVPDTPSIYPEALPSQLGEGYSPPGLRFIEAMGEIPGVTFVYPLADLLGARGGLDVYKKKDSHWTSFGAYIGYRAFMKAATALVGCRTVPPQDIQYSFRRGYGDLGSMTDPEQHEDVPIPSFSNPAPTFIRHLDGIARQTLIETSFGRQLPHCRALFFRDSFMTDLAPFIARSFSHVMTIGSTTRVMMDAVDSWEADLVVSQVAERKLPFLESDHQLEGYEAIYATDYQSQAGKTLLQARLAADADASGALAMIAPILSVYADKADHAFGAALILERNGLSHESNEFARSAAQVRRGQPSHDALAARTCLATGSFADAARFSRLAIQGAAGNAYYHELLVYALLQQHLYDDSVRAARDAIAHIHDHPNLWYWSSVAHRHVKDIHSALAHAQEAVSLCADSKAYQDHLSALSRA